MEIENKGKDDKNINVHDITNKIHLQVVNDFELYNYALRYKCETKEDCSLKRNVIN
jgi:hypothetical protein